MFEAMINGIKEEVIRRLFTVRIKQGQSLERKKVSNNVTEAGGGEVKKQPVRNASRKIGRNEPCPCGSGLKYKKCCGRNE